MSRVEINWESVYKGKRKASQNLMDGSGKTTQQNILTFSTDRSAVNLGVWGLEGSRRDKGLWAVAAGNTKHLTCTLKHE